MKRKIIFVLCCLFTWAAVAQERENVMWYSAPASNWNEALPVGNGRLGAMVYGGHRSETIQLNEESLWAGSKIDADAEVGEHLGEIQRLLINEEIEKAAALSEKYMRSNPMRIRSYQSFGELRIDMLDASAGATVKNFRRQLDLSTGIALTTFELNGVEYAREVFASAQSDVVAIRLAASKPGALTFRMSYAREQDATAYPVSDSQLQIMGQVMDLPDPDCGPAGMHMKFAGIIQGRNKGGEMHTSANAFYVQGADEVVFYVTAATDYNLALMDCDDSIDPVNKCKALIDRVKAEEYALVKEQHVQEHSSMFDRVSFDMGAHPDMPTNERLDLMKNGEVDLALITLYFQYGRYLLMNSSRAPGVLPANLQGIWNKDMYAAWNSDFHTNINIQMNYWPAEVCNLAETVKPLSDFINAIRVPGRETARKTYNSRGWTVNHVVDVFGHTSITDGVSWGTFPIAGAWLALHQWEHFLFTKDIDYLAVEAYPSMCGAAEFIMDFLVEDHEGHLVTAPSNSPENAYRLPDGKQFNLTYGATMDVEIINELFTACLRAGKELKNGNAAFDKRLKATMKRLPPLQVGRRYGTIQEWIKDYEEEEPGHRHVSHLFGLYPGTTITPKDKVLFDAARKTIERRRYYNESPEHRNGSYTGWSRAWMINFYARLMDGEAAGENVALLLQKSTQSNLFNIHPPFQIDGNFGGTAGIAEMLLQSHTDEIHLLPALPSSWKDGCIRGLRARGGVTVDMTWSDASLTYANLSADRDMTVRVRYGNVCRTLKLRKGDNRLSADLRVK